MNVTWSLLLTSCVLLGVGLAAEVTVPTAAEVQILRGRALLQDSKRAAEGRIEVVSGLIRRGRETGDPSHYVEAQQELDVLLKGEPRHFEGRKLQAGIWMGQERWKQAYALANELQKEVPDDIPSYGLVAESALALGLYDEATKATQWMFDLRPPGPLAYEKGVKVRAAYGDFSGAIDFAMQAARLVGPDQPSEKAEWIARLSMLELARGRATFAESYARQALALQPNHVAAIQALACVLKQPAKSPVSGAEVRSVQWAKARELAARPQDRRRALTLLDRMVTEAPTVEVLLLRSNVLGQVGRATEAKVELEKIQKIGVDVESAQRALAAGALPIR